MTHFQHSTYISHHMKVHYHLPDVNKSEKFVWKQRLVPGAKVPLITLRHTE